LVVGLVLLNAGKGQLKRLGINIGLSKKNALIAGLVWAFVRFRQFLRRIRK